MRKDMGKQATRDAYGQALADLSSRFDFVVLDADLSKSTKTATFQKVCPARFVNCGIAETNMMGIAAGIASTGRPVFASTFAMFAAGRAYDAVRNGIAYPRLNVKIAATHAGLSVGEDGATHQCIEDISLMRVIPGMVVCCPADGPSTTAAVRAALEHDGPVYLRLGRLAVPTLYEPDQLSDFSFGKGYVLREGSDVCIVATGLMTACPASSPWTKSCCSPLPKRRAPSSPPKNTRCWAAWAAPWRNFWASTAPCPCAEWACATSSAARARRQTCSRFIT